MQRLKRGILIAIEGIDGSGKSTLAHNISEYLKQQHLPVILTKEPGGSPLGKQLREILQTQTVPLSSKAEFLLFAADRAEHFQKIILPHLHANSIIISDRLSDSSLVYQGYGRGLDISMLRTINAWVMNGIRPDIVFYLKLAPEQAQERLIARNQKLTTFEQEHISFTKKLVYGFDEILKNRKDVILMDGTQSPEQLTQEAVQAIETWIKSNHLRE
ncbi:MAG TPA: dTMP kinase [Candidatus Dependentiae bacterium]|nr:dTMP kinase [Candidatus Dependentiae bacterium]HRQ62732.1 dTMP kinase [Candidatus Dependentiae bacterium]